MSFGRKLAKVLFCAFLGLSSMSGAPMDPKQIEEVLQIMNQTNIEVVIPEKNGSNDPDWPLISPDPTENE